MHCENCYADNELKYYSKYEFIVYLQYKDPKCITFLTREYKITKITF